MLAANLIALSKTIARFKWFPPVRGDILGQERGQALVRVGINAIVLLYLLFIPAPSAITNTVPAWSAVALYTLFSIGLFRQVLRAKTSPALRRYLANLADISAISYTMFASGEAGIPLFLLYLWVTLGNGFRFGVTALLISAISSLAGFGMVVSLTEAWHGHTALAASMALALVVVPLHAGHRLLQQKRDQVPAPNLLYAAIAPFKWLAPIGKNILGRERGQALVRVFISTILALYLIYVYGSIDSLHKVPPWLIMACYALFSIALFWHILRARTSPSPRRYLANLADIGIISYTMIAAGEPAMSLFMLYLWITFGNGFRYGSRALLVSALLSILGFGIVVTVSQVWQSQPAFTVSVALTLLVLPMYAAHLVNQLNKAIARAEVASAAKSQFLARMSHELRTPFNGILGATELLEAGRRLTPDERSLLQIIRESVNVSLRQINNILDFSKIEANKLTLERAGLDLHEIINSAAGMVRPLAMQKGLRFLVRIAPETPYRLIGDPHHLRAILLNLLSNAVKFTERGRVCLEIAGKNVADPRVVIRFEVHDTGIGIAPDALHRIFESFTQEDDGTTRAYGGTGLGTTIAKQLVELMGGQIGVESVKHRGSLFWYEIPLDQQPPAEGQDRLPGTRVLLVSRDARVVEHYTPLLNALDSQLINVGSSEEALDTLARAVRLNNPVQAVFMDASLALQEDGSHRHDQLCEKMASIQVPAILVSDIAPPVEQLREWGYSAVLARRTEQRLVFAVLHAAPKASAEADRGVVSVAPWVWSRREGVRRRLLVADDNRTNLIIVRRMLEGTGYDVDVAETGDEALERLCAGNYRLAIVDMHMPGLDGLDLLRRYRMLRPRSHLPIIMLTANASLEAQQQSAEAGADAYLTKPVTAAELLREVERLIKDTQIEALPSRLSQSSGTNAAAPAGDPTILDISVLAELDRLYHNPHELAQLMAEYEREGRALLEKIAQTVAARNHPAFCDGVHALKSNAANVGATKLMQACRQAEAAGIVEFMRNRQPLLVSMQNAFTETLLALRKLLMAAPQDKSADRSTRKP